MSVSLVLILYLISAVLFILALRGLSHPKSARLGNIFGIIGMVIAVFTTLMMKNVLSYVEIGVAVLIGGQIGNFLNLKIFPIRILVLVTAGLVLFVAIRMAYKLFI